MRQQFGQLTSNTALSFRIGPISQELGRPRALASCLCPANYYRHNAAENSGRDPTDPRSVDDAIDDMPTCCGWCGMRTVIPVAFAEEMPSGGPGMGHRAGGGRSRNRVSGGEFTYHAIIGIWQDRDPKPKGASFAWNQFIAVVPEKDT